MNRPTCKVTVSVGELSYDCGTWLPCPDHNPLECAMVDAIVERLSGQLDPDDYMHGRYEAGADIREAIGRVVALAEASEGMTPVGAYLTACRLIHKEIETAGRGDTP